MQDMILLKQGEIVLKGLNRRRFEQRLVSNIARRLRPYGSFQVYTLQSTVYVEPQSDGCDMDGALEALKTVFGIVALTRAAACAKDRDAIVEKAISYLAPAMRRAKSFKVETRRSDKSFPMTSIQLSQYVGGLLAEAFPDVAVDVHTPELVVNVEVRDRAAYVHAGAEPGAGGMPVGSNGTAVTLLSGGIDSPVSSYMIAKRGVRLIPVHFFSFPYTSEAAKEKVIALGRRLTPYCGQMRLAIVPFTRIQEEIRDKCPEPYFTILMRRFMMRIADRLARDNGCGALVTGENLGQVASQTMQALAVTEEVCTLPVLRPLIGFDKTEIVDRARKIGTYELSVLPYEDCCTVFTPRHPELRPELERARAAEAELDVERLVEEAVRGTEYVRLEEAEP
ncbi:MAG: tRNA 4-thiouridine(8) synthase ThiI [Oscillospiraceae bacterium]|nr:tRNA 4-thiouridine(8) synthase ThiI [Oscillospiraceae bacterium]MCD8359066.1 tRNA 4-thiouridine(8) synthase ThiI [Oscillospiraceae bacterium]MCD8390005.1 tRNA 4-thiouridine(8) synthase ThiI [Oscillospiraceae bacterium]